MRAKLKQLIYVLWSRLQKKPRLQKKLKKLRAIVIYPGRAVRPDTFIAARVYLWLMKLVFLKDFLRRRQYVTRPPNNRRGNHIDKSQGFITFYAGDEQVVSRAIECGLALTSVNNIKEMQKSSKKPFLLSRKLNCNDRQTWPIFRLACDPLILCPVTEYLGMLPILDEAVYLYSPNESLSPAGSQKFHLDGEDYKQVKAFIYLDGVDENAGPLTVIDADHSKQLYQTLKKSGLTRRRNQKHDDETVFRFIDKNAVQKLCGPRGTISLVDTCSCYHYGSRHGKRPRIVILLHYTTPYSKSIPIFNRKYITPNLIEQMPNADKELYGLVLGPRSRSPK